MSRQRIIGRISHDLQKDRDARLRAAWLAIPTALHSRPEPRSAWDAAARADCPTSPWDKTVDPCRSALRAAYRTGDRAKVRSVKANIEFYMELMKSEIFAVVPVEEETSILRLAIEETEAQGEADCAVQELLAGLLPDGSVPPQSLEKAEAKLTRHETVLRRCRTMLGSLLRTGTAPRHHLMRAAR